MRKVNGISVFFLLNTLLLISINLYAKTNGDKNVWSYKGKTSSEFWHTLTDEYSICKDGMSQSPIDISDTKKSEGSKIVFYYANMPLEIINTGNITRIYVSQGSYIIYNKVKYQLTNIDFHCPSEHTRNGKTYSGEIQLFHQNSKGKRLIISVFIGLTKENEFFDLLIKYLPHDINRLKKFGHVMINPSDFLPSYDSYYKYEGSLTYPPCEEGITWIIMRSPLSITWKQLKKLKKVAKNNIRDVQEINTRDIYEVIKGKTKVTRLSSKHVVSGKSTAEVFWSYDGGAGPENWGNLTPEYRDCRHGKKQSPINIYKYKKEKLNEIKFNYANHPLKLINNSHTLRITFTKGSFILIGTDKYDLKYMEFHYPSEHKLKGRQYHFEIQFFHENDNGKIVVVSVFLKKGIENPVITELWHHFPKEQNKPKSVFNMFINPADLLPTTGSYYTYVGSLTKPPCKEGVVWYIMEEPLEMSFPQINRFAALIGENIRPLQSSYNKDVQYNESKDISIKRLPLSISDKVSTDNIVVKDNENSSSDNNNSLLITLIISGILILIFIIVILIRVKGKSK